MLRFPDPDCFDFEDTQKRNLNESFPHKFGQTYSEKSKPNIAEQPQISSRAISDEQFQTVKTWLRDALLALDESRLKVSVSKLDVPDEIS